ncbi:hypothetical protein BD410DRAFT_780573 [Rickenella mellea]|uniref:Transcription initiation factor TFIID subunit 4 n=1 Tax=Rickenella mellea TaxID=50990 RepID=A0A4R5XFV3_9AGAM|nr:hypothetical protein BD410DRAFT_780573 [Rickenella mellea]
MKLEHDAASPVTTPGATTPGAPTAYPATQWATSQIPIDPVLQQQSQTAQPQAQAQTQPQQQYTMSSYPHYQPYTQSYGQTGYPAHTHYQQYSASQQPSASGTSRQTQSNDIDTTDVATLNDALGSAGVDLRAEEETLQRSHDHHQSYRTHEDRTRRQPSTPNFDSRILGATMRDIGTKHKVVRIPEDSVNYLALALRTRLQNLVTAMAAAAHHRTTAQFDRPPGLYDPPEEGADGLPMWSVVVRRDTRKQLEALERVEREEETRIRRERKERADAAAAQAAAAAAAQASASAGMDSGGYDDGGYDGGGGGRKPKKKKDGPGVTAKNMSEDVAKRLSNAAATHFAGLGRGKYAWMNAGNVPANTAPKVKAGTPAPGAGAGGGGGAATGATTPGGTQAGSSWAKPYVPSTPKAGAQEEEEDPGRVITIRDALFVVERERGHGGGKGAARGWV